MWIFYIFVWLEDLIKFAIIAKAATSSAYWCEKLFLKGTLRISLKEFTEEL